MANSRNDSPALHSRETEEALIGSLLIHPESLDLDVPDLVPDLFFHVAPRLVFRAIRELQESKVGVDVLTLTERLERSGDLEAIGGAVYLTKLIGASPTSLHVRHYADILTDYLARRRAVEFAEHVARRAYEVDKDFDPLDLAPALEAIHVTTARLDEYGVDAVDARFGEFAKTTKSNRGAGIPVYIQKLREAMGNLRRKELTILAARPSMGKTSFLLNLLCDVAARSSFRVGLFTAEQSADALWTRLALPLAGIPFVDFVTGAYDVAAEGRLTTVRESLRAKFADRLHIVDDLYDPFEIARFQSRHKFDLWAVDHLGELVWPFQKEEARLWYPKAVGLFRRVARKTDSALIVVHQLSRAVEARADKRPVMSDLRESGELEQKADNVLMLYRDDYYNPKTIPAGVSPVSATELWIRKQRQYLANSVVRLDYDLTTQRFTSTALTAGRPVGPKSHNGNGSNGNGNGARPAPNGVPHPDPAVVSVPAVEVFAGAPHADLELEPGDLLPPDYFNWEDELEDTNR